MERSNQRTGSTLVRINGRRVDVAQIEAALLRHPGVLQCAVIVHKKGNEQALIACFTAREHVELEAWLTEEIMPGYMRPHVFAQLDGFPLQEDGRVNREALQLLATDSLLQLGQWKSMLRDGENEAFAVVTRERIMSPELLHVRDLLSQDEFFRDEADAAAADDAASETDDEDRPLAIVHGGEPRDDGQAAVISQLLDRAAARSPHRGIRFVGRQGEETGLTYPELLREAEQVLGGLQAAGVGRADRVIFQLDDNREFVAAFWACIMGGIVLIPVNVPKNPEGSEAEMLGRVWEMAGRPVILAGKNGMDGLRTVARACGIGEDRLLEFQTLQRSAVAGERYEASPEDTAILLFTSGSTGTPKGVVQTHEALMTHQRGMNELHRYTEEDVYLNWMPLEHVGGILMSHVNPVGAACSQIHVKTDFVLEKPVRWIELMSRWLATTTWAPNFAYALVADAMETYVPDRWELSCLKRLLNGGEGINDRSIRKFMRALEPFGLPRDAMKPCWGMSETSSGTLFSYDCHLDTSDGVHILDKTSLGGRIRPALRQQDQATFTELGVPIPGMSARIADEQGRTLRENTVGKLQVQGKVITVGYYNNPEANAAAFTADGWFDTGDLAFIQNGRITITGRAKDVIIMNGVNYNNGEIEAIVDELDQVETSFTAACVVKEPGSQTDKAVIFFCPVEDEENKVAETIGLIRKEVGAKTGLHIEHAIPMKREDIPKTNIGKIQRSKLSGRFETGEFHSLLRRLDLQAGNDNTLPQWFMAQRWVSKQEAADVKKAGETCLLLEGSTRLGVQLSQLLESHGHTCIRVQSGDRFKKVDERRYEMDMARPENFKLLLQQLRSDGHESMSWFHLGAEAGEREEKASAHIAAGLRDGLFSLACAIRSAAEAGLDELRLLAATRMAQQVTGGDTLQLGAGGVSGYIRSAQAEMPGMSLTVVDLEDGDASEQAECLLREWSNAKPSIEAAYRGGARYEPTLQWKDLTQHSPLAPSPIQAGAVYLVTGGMGGIGAEVSKHLAASYGAKLVLIGRSPLPAADSWNGILERDEAGAERIRSYLEIRALCPDVLYAAGDVGDEAFLAETAAEAQRRFGSGIKGVFHLAGEGNLEEHWQDVEQRYVRTASTELLERMFKAKAYGSAALHNLISEERDSLFVAFSSVNSRFGAASFSAYSAANSFLDHFCAYRQSLGYGQTYGLNWSSWDNLGMNANQHASSAAAGKGFMPLSRVKGIRSLEIALRVAEPQLFIGLNPANRSIRGDMLLQAPGEMASVLFVEAEWAKSEEAKRLLEARPEEAGVVELAALPRTAKGDVDYEALLVLVGRSSANERADEEPLSEPERRLAQIWSDVLGAAGVGARDDFFQLGGHSLKATTLLARISKEFGVVITLQKVFEFSGLREMAAHIQELLTAQSDGQSPREAKESEASPAGDAAGLRRRELGYHELSHAQKRIYFSMEMDKDSIAYNTQAAWEINGALDKHAVRLAFGKLAERHQALRSTFTVFEEQPVQMIHPTVTIPFEWLDLSALSEEEREQATAARIRSEWERVYDLERGPLLFVTLLGLGADRHLLLVSQHHIIADGWSLSLMLREFAETYEAISQFNIPVLPPIHVPLTDFIAEQNRQVAVNRKDQAYWLKRLEGPLPSLQLPTDYPRPLVQSYRGATELIRVERSLKERLEQMSKSRRCSMYMTFLSAYSLLLGRLSGQEEMIIGSPVAGRSAQNAQQHLGMFVNTLPVRLTVQPDETLASYMERVKHAVLDAFEHQDYPFDKLVEDLNPERDMSRSAIFQAALSYMNEPLALALAHTTFKQRMIEYYVTKFDITLSIFEHEDAVSVYVEYNTDLFDSSTIRRWSDYFLRLLEQMAEAKQAVTVGELELLGASEYRRLVVEWNDTTACCEREPYIPAIFEAVAARQPERAALAHGDRLLTYAELNEQANKLAAALTGQGIVPGDAVALLTERSAEMIIGILGIMKAGAAYLPIDPGAPQSRIDELLADSGAKLVLTREAIDEWLESMPERPEGWRVNPVPPQDGDALAYLMYTSGSTGKPKGTMTTHRNIVRVVTNTNYIRIVPEDVLPQLSNYAFDGSTFDIFGALLNGAKLVLVDKDAMQDADKLADCMIQEGVTVFFATTSLFNAIVDTRPDCLAQVRHAVFGGERASVSHLRKAYAAMGPGKLINGYGPTESTVFATTYTLTSDPGEQLHIPIGKPVSNTQVYVLNSRMQVQPTGVAGELYIAGDGLAKGYLNREELTRERFLPHPFLAGERIYRTGDLARWLPDGNVEYLGRIDNQVKLRGYRIECAEIAEVLQRHEAVGECIVVPQLESGICRRLIGYVVKEKNGGAYGEAELKSFLSSRLPDYMVPEQLVLMEQLPLTRNGKIDIGRLPAPEKRSDSVQGYAAPRNDTERQIAECFGEVLQVQEVGIFDSFFDSGGDSIRSIQVVSRLKQRGLRIDPKQIFMLKTPAALAECAESWESAGAAKERMPSDYLIDLNDVQIQAGSASYPEHLPRIFLAPPAGGTVMGYMELTSRLSGTALAFGLQAPGLFDDEELQLQSYEELVELFTETIMDKFRPGVDYLGGHSMGGHIAYGMCHQLAQRGLAPKALIILDTIPDVRMETEDRESMSEEQFKLNVLKHGMGNLIGVEQSALDPLGFAEMKQVILQAAQRDNRFQSFMDDAYLDKYLSKQMHDLVLSQSIVIEEKPLDIPIQVLKTAALPEYLAIKHKDWLNFTTAGCEFTEVPGNHMTMLQPPLVVETAERLKRVIMGQRQAAVSIPF